MSAVLNFFSSFVNITFSFFPARRTDAFKAYRYHRGRRLCGVPRKGRRCGDRWWVRRRGWSWDGKQRRHVRRVFFFSRSYPITFHPVHSRSVTSYPIPSRSRPISSLPVPPLDVFFLDGVELSSEENWRHINGGVEKGFLFAHPTPSHPIPFHSIQFQVGYLQPQ